MEKWVLDDLIAYCQRCGILSTDSGELINELKEITGLGEDTLKEITG